MQLGSGYTKYVVAILGVTATGVLPESVIDRISTKHVLTNRRIITKRAFVARETIAMNLTKVESLRITQGPMGPILKFGDITIVGVGASPEPICGIANPLELRRQIGTVMLGGHQ